MNAETLVSPPPLGAGRTADWDFPDPLQLLVNTSVPNQFRNRLNGSTLAVGIVASGGAPGALGARVGGGAGGTSYAGPAAEFTAPLGGIQRATASLGPLVWLNLFKDVCGFQAGTVDYGVTNIAARYAMRAVVGVQPGADAGLQVTTANSNLMDNVNNTGFGFLRPAANQVEFVVIAVVGTVQRFNITPAGFNESALNEYRLTFVGASKSANATVTASLNGVPRKTVEWTRANYGVTMPALPGGNPLGLYISLTWGQNGFLDVMAPGGWNVSQAPTVPNTL